MLPLSILFYVLRRRQGAMLVASALQREQEEKRCNFNAVRLIIAG